jgi:glycosyltransferase involved in cell wall biosynthesis
MKYLVASDSPKSPTGMAWQMRYLAKYLLNRGEDVEYMGWQNVVSETYKEGTKDVNVHASIPISPNNDQLFGKAMYPTLFDRLKPDFLVTLGDAWMVNQIPQYKKRPFWIMYFPVDGHPLNQDMINTISRADMPVAMSKFGKALVEQTLRQPCQYIPHQIDYGRFQKASSKKKYKQARAKYFPQISEDTLLFGSIARANPRKHHMRLFRAFEIFVRENMLTPDDVRLYLHADPKDVMYHTRLNAHDYFFVEFIDTLGIEDYIIFPFDSNKDFTFSKGTSENELLERMSALDVHVNPTGGEGFGVPTLETMAMGKPQIITDYTTSRELIAHKHAMTPEPEEDPLKQRGILVPPKFMYLENSKVHKAWVDVDAFAEALATYYHDESLRKAHGNAGKSFARQFDSKRIGKEWDKVLAKIPNVEVQGDI